MKPCRNTKCRQSGTDSRQESHVNRYSHPIRTRTARQPGAEELLEQVLDRLARQEEALEELLRRTEKKDTI